MAMANRFIPGLPPMGAPNAGAEMVVENNATEETSRMALANLILGTVSQSGGVPTGAIIERGSNSNGEFVRFADGAQICAINNASASFVNSSNLRFDWTYPATFAAIPTVTPQGLYQGFSSKFRQTTHFVYSRGASESSCQIGFGSDSGWVDGDQDLGETLNVIAIGRWF